MRRSAFTLVELPAVSRRERTGFTLVELLVVVSIIALLIALLLPALNKARQTAVVVRCTVNARQIGLGMTYYEQDQAGWWPVHQFQPVPSTAYFNAMGSYEKFYLRSSLNPYLSETMYEVPNARVVPPNSVFRCPSYDVGLGDRVETYAGLLWHFWDGVTKRLENNESIVNWCPGFFSMPSAAPVQWCSTRKTPINNARNGPSWHDSFARPTVFIDGHAKALTESFYTDVSGAIRESDRDVHMLSSDHDGYWKQAGDFALSEY